MRTIRRISITAIGCCAFLFSREAFCQIRLPRLVSDGMVLQRNADVKIWGWAAAGEAVTIRFLDKTYQTLADDKGEWLVMLSNLDAGGPHTMEIAASNRITLNNLLIGDVWVCSGQSNMALPMSRVADRYPDEIASSDNPFIRQFAVPVKYAYDGPRENLETGNWEPANPTNVLRFSATAYFFARALFEKYPVPIGLINASVGGSAAEAWLSEDALREYPHYLEIVRKNQNAAYVDSMRKSDAEKAGTWHRLLGSRDKGLHDKMKWSDPACDVLAWRTMTMPAFWADEGLGPVNGTIWFRKDFDVPASMTGLPARLLLGRIVDADSVFINGTFVGWTSYQYPPRKYNVPENVLKPGKNCIVVKIINTQGKGGFIKDKPYRLTAGGQTVDLTGEWRYRLGAEMASLSGPAFIEWEQPSCLYNGMLAPLFNYAIKGVIWYQGETNANRAKEYQRLFPDLIAEWRRKWNRGDFPFLFVQLPNYSEAKDEPSESQWAEMREAQLKTLTVPNTGMAVAIDLGEWNDIHPLNKQDVGERLALAARKIAYGENGLVFSGPLYQSMKIDGGKIILTFSNIGGGLVVKGGGDPQQFAIAGSDKNFVRAKAKIEGDQVTVWNDLVSNPVFVRYAWADNPEGANLYNKEGLPASPFRTGE